MIFDHFRPVKNDWKVGFDFWESKRRKNIAVKKPGLNLRFFLLAAVLTLTTQNSVWAEMKTLRLRDAGSVISIQSQPVEVNASQRVGDNYRSEENAQTVGNSAPGVERNLRVSSVGNPVARVSRLPVTTIDSPSVFGRTIISEDDVFKAITNLSPTVKNIIGDGGVSRLIEFTRYSAGWDGERSKGLNAGSIESLNRFFSVGRFDPPDAAVFMSSDGHVVVNWHANSYLVELEFEEEGLQFFFAESDEEGFVASARYGDFKRRLAATT